MLSLPLWAVTRICICLPYIPPSHGLIKSNVAISLTEQREIHQINQNIFQKKASKNILNRPEKQMSGTLIYYWARLWIQQSLGLIDNTASSASPLSFHKLSFTARSSHNSLYYCLSHPLELFLGCVLSILSRGVLLSWLWIRFFPVLIVPVLQ